ncbi:3544_t:CDS:2, partial [Diversispora eburnea]
NDENLELCEDQLIKTWIISDYFTDEPLYKYIHIIVRSPIPPVKFDLVCLFCTKDETYSLFIEFIQVAKELKPNEKSNPFNFCNLKINDMTYEEVRDLIYELRYCEEHDSEEVTGQLIRFIPEGKEFLNARIPPQSFHDPLPTWEKISQDLQKVFDKTLDNELRPSFRKVHYNLVDMSIGYKQIQGKYTDELAIILYVHQKGILRLGCGGSFSKEICEYPVDVIEACVTTPYSFYKSRCLDYQKNILLGSSIGVIGSQRTSGTIGVVVIDKDSKQIGILSCEHVYKFNESSSEKGNIIYQPSHDNLDERKQEFIGMALDDERYKEDSERMYCRIEENRQNSKLARYDCLIQNNFFSITHQKSFGVDVAFCILTNKSRTLCPDKFSVLSECFKKVKLPENTCLNSFYTYKDFDDIDELEVFKVESETGLSCGKLVPVSTAVSIDLTNESIKFAERESLGEIPQIPSSIEFTDKEYFIGYMKSGDFECGDSKASVVNQKGKALDILHLLWMTKFN